MRALNANAATKAALPRAWETGENRPSTTRYPVTEKMISAETSEARTNVREELEIVRGSRI
jgi:hypothetical protein